MQDDPPADLIIAQVRAALEQGLAPGFPQKVAANALGIAAREIFEARRENAAEYNRLAHLVGCEGDLADRNQRLAERVRSGSVQDWDEVIAHLIFTTLAKLRVDQPHYPALRQLIDKS